MGLKERYRERLGPVTMHVEPGRIRLSNGNVITTDWWGQPLKFELAYALRLAQEGEVIGVRGKLAGSRIGGFNVGKLEEAARLNGQPLPRVAVVADDDLDHIPQIGDCLIAGSAIQTQGGIEDLTFFGVDFWNRRNAKAALLVEMGIRTGALRLLFCTGSSEDTQKWSGYGRMWYLRAHGFLDEVELVGNEVDDALEHALVYADNIGWKTQPRHRISNNTVRNRGGGRTCIQLCNRANEGVSGGGSVVIEDNVLRCEGGGGGGAITIAGHGGPVTMRRNSIQLIGGHSGVVVWSDVGHGLHQREDGFTTGRVLIENVSIEGGDRPHIAVSGAKKLQLSAGFRLKANGSLEHCVDVDNLQGGPIPNGPVEFINIDGPIDQYSGFQSGAKVRIDNRTLTAAELLALQK